MLTAQEARNLADRIFGMTTLPECALSLSSTEDVFIRFANNGITTSGYRVEHSVSINATTGDKRSGSAAVSEFSEEALRKGVEKAESLARISQPDPEDMPPLGPQQYPVIRNFDSATAAGRGDVLIGHVRAILEAARTRQLTAAGLVQRTATASAVANRAGLFGYHESTYAGLTNTMRNSGGTSSGWATQVSTTVHDLNGEDAGRIAADKCVRGVGKKRLDPGKYTVILEPAAVSDLIGFLGWSLGARGAEQGFSFLSRKGKEGETLLGEKLFPEIVTLCSDPFHPKLGARPWAQELIPNEALTWIDKGVVKNLHFDRFWAQKAGKKATPFPENLILEGQDHSLSELIASVERGLLVTRFWYIRTLQPQTLQVTGLTRDGVFLVEHGKLTDPVMNFRWNESPVRVLQNTTMLGRSVPTQGAEAGSSISPPLVATDFNFSSISDAV